MWQFADLRGRGLARKRGWYFRGVDTPMHTMTAQKMKFSIKDFFSKWPNTQKSADLVTFTEEIFNWKLHFCVAVLLYPPFPYTLNAYQNKLAYNHTRTYATGFRIFFGGEALVLATRTLKAFCNDWPWLKMFSMKIQMFIMRYVNDH